MISKWKSLKIIIGTFAVIAGCNASSMIQISDTVAIQTLKTQKIFPLKDIVSNLGEVKDPLFRTFVSEISNTIQIRYRIDEICSQKDSNNPTSGVIFIQTPLIISDTDEIINLLIDRLDASRAGFLVDSPWVKVVRTVAPACGLKIYFLWNERQFLIDQAVISNPVATAGYRADPIEGRAFADWAQAYEDVVLQQGNKPDSTETISKLRSSIPDDVIWLFTHSPQSTRGSFSVIALSAAQRLREKALMQYTEMVLHILAGQDLQSSRSSNFKTIADVYTADKLQNLRINMP
ncbi:hypothetical protein OPKNFCMD_4028 [Methylobacterium crusticola]|uniref:TPM domain-containing protein n=1 Tax=Methylobacterium crusticola TaxID=1697972 RepID=A0ABQ4R293_9HYPH|nr:hypothetical protein [Methylobacterium crusticola]GJD51275.1 hypothetical protein OPKNFCMD_4028 [Methylobacterium crusticola]